MYELNVVATVAVTQALLPALRASGAGLIVTWTNFWWVVCHSEALR